MKYCFLLLLAILFGFGLRAQGALDVANMRVEPPNWWTGMRHNEVALLLHADNIGTYSVSLKGAKGVQLVRVDRAESPNYLFVTLRIGPKAPAQTLSLQFVKGKESFQRDYPLLARKPGWQPGGLDASDVIYLVFPDRFANGDPSNDNVAGMLQGLERDSLLGRHGGDLQGVMDHLDYIADLGMTAIWLNPELENDQPRESYHGYALTDHYRVDRRLGSNELLRELIEKAHGKGIKMIRDVVLNHVGSNHYWMRDLPFADWVNTWPEFTRTTYRAPTLLDPYASEYDKKRFNDGWFDRTMPDLNQRNPFLAQYLIQQAIWWVEFAGFDALRIDTYTYSDQAFMSRWCAALQREYPTLHMMGEIWEHGVIVQGFFADNQPMRRARFDSNLPGVIDFQPAFAIHEALNREQGWTEGVARMYYVLAQDYFYEDPSKNMIFLDNHDFSRFYSIVGESLPKYKSGVAWLLTCRGIPQVYYATEILGTGWEHPSHGNIRKDFPGGWAGDPVNKFTASGRTPDENEAFEYMRELARYRKRNPVLHTGKLMQFVPENSVYVYFRYDDVKTVMVVLNTANSEREIETQRFSERMRGFRSAREVVSGETLSDLSRLRIPANSPLVLELQR